MKVVVKVVEVVVKVVEVVVAYPWLIAGPSLEAICSFDVLLYFLLIFF